MDEVQVPDKAFGRAFDELAVQVFGAACAPAHPGELQLLAIVFK
jgi:hypothetical protein